MRTLALVVLAAACGGGSKPAKAPAPAPDPAPAPEVGTKIKVNIERPAEAMPRKDAVAEAAPAPAPAPPPDVPAPLTSALPLLDRGHDKAGDVPGMKGWTTKRVDDKTVCGGTRIEIGKLKIKLDNDQNELKKIYGISLPKDLSFDPANKKKVEDSMRRFDAFVKDLTKTGESVHKYFEGQLMANKNDPALSTAAIARLAQVNLQMASTLARAPIPKDVRTGEAAAEKIDAYCSKMEEVALPLATRGREALLACAKSGAPGGWYAAYCATATE